MEGMYPPIKPKEVFKEQLAANAANKTLRLSPTREGDGSEISIIKGLGAEQYLKEVWMRARGYDYNFFKKKWEQKTDPIMSEEGIRNLMTVLTMILRMDFSFMDDKEIPKIVLEFYKTNFPQFAIYHEDFGLNLKNINVLQTACFFPAYIAAKNARHAGHRNVVRGTLSESVFARALASSEDKKGGVMSLFRRKKSVAGGFYG